MQLTSVNWCSFRKGESVDAAWSDHEFDIGAPDRSIIISAILMLRRARPKYALLCSGQPLELLVLLIAAGQDSQIAPLATTATRHPTRCLVPPFAGLAAMARRCSQHKRHGAAGGGDASCPLPVVRRAQYPGTRYHRAHATHRPVGLQAVGGARHVGQALSTRFCRASFAGLM